MQNQRDRDFEKEMYKLSYLDNTIMNKTAFQRNKELMGLGVENQTQLARNTLNLQKEAMDKMFPGTNPWERLGSSAASSVGGGPVQAGAQGTGMAQAIGLQREQMATQRLSLIHI